MFVREVRCACNKEVELSEHGHNTQLDESASNLDDLSESRPCFLEDMTPHHSFRVDKRDVTAFHLEEENINYLFDKQIDFLFSMGKVHNSIQSFVFGQKKKNFRYRSVGPFRSERERHQNEIFSSKLINCSVESSSRFVKTKK